MTEKDQEMDGEEQALVVPTEPSDTETDEEGEATALPSLRELLGDPSKRPVEPEAEEEPADEDDDERPERPAFQVPVSIEIEAREARDAVEPNWYRVLAAQSRAMEHYEDEGEDKDEPEPPARPTAPDDGSRGGAEPGYPAG